MIIQGILGADLLVASSNFNPQFLSHKQTADYHIMSDLVQQIGSAKRVTIYANQNAPSSCKSHELALFDEYLYCDTIADTLTGVTCFLFGF